MTTNTATTGEMNKVLSEYMGKVLPYDVSFDYLLDVWEQYRIDTCNEHTTMGTYWVSMAILGNDRKTAFEGLYRLIIEYKNRIA